MTRPFKLTKLGKAIVKAGQQTAASAMAGAPDILPAKAPKTDAPDLQDIAAARAQRVSLSDIEAAEATPTPAPALDPIPPAPVALDVSDDQVAMPIEEDTPAPARNERCAPGWATPMAMSERSQFQGEGVTFDLLPEDVFAISSPEPEPKPAQNDLLRDATKGKVYAKPVRLDEKLKERADAQARA